MSGDDVVLDGLDFDVDVDQLRSDGGIALASPERSSRVCSTAICSWFERIGRQYRVVAPTAPSFAPARTWDPSRDEIGIVIDGDGRPICAVGSEILCRP